MRLFTTAAALHCYLNSHSSAKQRSLVALVPTMGALHAGHLSLIQRARLENQVVVVSIFVNPLQFGPDEDFQQYPRSLEQDQLICQEAGVDVIFAPSAEELGTRIGNNSELPVTTVVPPAAMTSVLCGKSRPGHFQGVATIVTKLLNLARPDVAYFGQKDAQQVAIIRRLVADLNLSVKIVSCAIAREESGLAWSSRNQYLSSQQRLQAAALYRSLQRAQSVFQAGERAAVAICAAVHEELAAQPAVQVEYVELVDPNSLSAIETVEAAGLLAIAARVGSTRLIDNIILLNRRPIVAIDGPAGAGKSTVTKQVAQVLGLMYLDTGAMYRAVTWLVLQTGTSLDDEPAIAELVAKSHLEFTFHPSSFALHINGEDVTEAIRSLEVTSHVSTVAALPVVRHFMVKQQQHYGSKGGIVAEGRDIGTNVFPDAEVKIFLTASVKERSRRRLLELQARGQDNISLEQLELDIALRDRKDSTRTVAPLCKAVDAIEIETDGLSVAQVTEQIVNLYKQRNVGKG
ncbi:MAG TPA: bifunctional pantoate--beta-alanine ligase/(d)CMP kinase [Kamptonema sp.]|nr:bifunctional pantoate--beta-alanine ligase/(d)CMP kinase [Kamptonema sp.]